MRTPQDTNNALFNTRSSKGEMIIPVSKITVFQNQRTSRLILERAIFLVS